MCFIISLGQCTIIVKIKNVKIIYVKDLLNDRSNDISGQCQNGIQND